MTDGILCIDKPAEMTSFLCCAILRRLLGVKKIGHAGTLDPNATGVLPLLVGRATKALDHLPVHDKRYTATMQFGLVSDTLDIWGQVSKCGDTFPALTDIREKLPQLCGEIRQTPPMTSAIKKDGVRLYDLARQGIEVERQSRPVTIYSLNILSYDEKAGLLTVDCSCSKGTYIRTLCDDLGRLLGCGAVMTALRRTEAAGYSLDDCISLEQARAYAEDGTLTEHVHSIESCFMTYPAVSVSERQAVRFGNGGALALERLNTAVNTTVRVLSPDKQFLGLGYPLDGELKIQQLF